VQGTGDAAWCNTVAVLLSECCWACVREGCESLTIALAKDGMLAALVRWCSQLRRTQPNDKVGGWVG
jgi:hypothetical protein